MVSDKKDISESELLSIASNFLGYCATLPYTNGNQKLARQWVIDKVQNPTNGAIRSIGKVRFSIGETPTGTQRLVEMDIVGSPQ